MASGAVRHPSGQCSDILPRGQLSDTTWQCSREEQYSNQQINLCQRSTLWEKNEILEEAVASGSLTLTLLLFFVQEPAAVNLSLANSRIFDIKTPAKSLSEALDGIRVQLDGSI